MCAGVLQVGYLKKLAREDKGPFPRQQDIPPDAVHVGLPPGRKFSLSHGWASEMHPCPSGAKLRRLVEELDKAGADDEDDGAFIDYCSLPQVCCFAFAHSASGTTKDTSNLVF